MWRKKSKETTIKLKKAKSCNGCYGYNDASFQKGYCALGFDVEQLHKKPTIGRTSTLEYWPFFCKPAEPCYKPLTASEYVLAFKTAHNLK